MTEEPPPEVLQAEHADDSQRSPVVKSAPSDVIDGNVRSNGKFGRKKGRVSEMKLSEENRRRSPRLSGESDGRGSSSRSVKVCYSIIFLSRFFVSPELSSFFSFLRFY